MESPDDSAERSAEYERLLAAARRVGMSLERLHRALATVARNEAETRRFLAENVYGVPDDLLDELVRVRLADLAKGEDEAR